MASHRSKASCRARGKGRQRKRLAGCWQQRGSGSGGSGGRPRPRARLRLLEDGVVEAQRLVLDLLLVPRQLRLQLLHLQAAASTERAAVGGWQRLQGWARGGRPCAASPRLAWASRRCCTSPTVRAEGAASRLGAMAALRGWRAGLRLWGKLGREQSAGRDLKELLRASAAPNSTFDFSSPPCGPSSDLAVLGACWCLYAPCPNAIAVLAAPRRLAPPTQFCLQRGRREWGQHGLGGT